MLLSGQASPNRMAEEYLNSLIGHQTLGVVARFLADILRLVCLEVSNACDTDPTFGKKLNRAARSQQVEPWQFVWPVLFPNGDRLLHDYEGAVKRVRQRRIVTNLRLNPVPIRDPLSEVLFTANALVAPPGEDRTAGRTAQEYYYDHPMPLDTPYDRNEIAHGLNELSRALCYEQARNPGCTGRRLPVVLSFSGTHSKLGSLGLAALRKIFPKGSPPGIRVYAFDENGVDHLKAHTLRPAAERYKLMGCWSDLEKVFGVEGDYGRHYGFLKAVAAWWSVLVDSTIRATYKFDLDQAFDQKKLVEQTGFSALEHLRNPLWGAEGVDYWGNRVRLGMLAGTLVNKVDLDKGLWSPDVTRPTQPPGENEIFFHSSLLRACCTEAEMMNAFGAIPYSGPDYKCSQRFFVTGGTTGILVDDLFNYQPFVPRFMGRGEDQAYLWKTMFDQPRSLRCLHTPGLVMRHDKDRLVNDDDPMARITKLIGDCVRTIQYSRLAELLAWSKSEVEEMLFPYPGCFLSPIPITMAFLRWSYRTLQLFEQGPPELALELVFQGTQRLKRTIGILNPSQCGLQTLWEGELSGWGLYYEILKRLQKDLSRNDAFALMISEKARRLVRDCLL